MADGGTCCATAAQIEAGQDSLSSGPSPSSLVLIVPDGVAKVKIALTRKSRTERSLTLTAGVENNIVAFRMPQPVENLAVDRITWYGPSGAVIRPREPSPTPTSAGLEASFAALRRPATSQDTLPGPVRSLVQGVALSRRVLDTPDSTTWLVLTPVGRLCLLSAIRDNPPSFHPVELRGPSHRSPSRSHRACGADPCSPS